MKTKALNLIKDLYKTKGGSVGGYGHIVFDDGNIENSHIQWCINEANNNKNKYNLSEETRIASIKALECFLTLTYCEREEIHNRFWIEN